MNSFLGRAEVGEVFAIFSNHWKTRFKKVPMIGKIAVGALMLLATPTVRAADVIPDNGPFAGGNSVTITNGTFGTITNVTIGGAAAAIVDSGANWVTAVAPATGAAGLKTIVIQTSDSGNTTLTGAYTVNPAGEIGASVIDWSRWGEVEGLPIERNNMVAGSLNGELYAAGGQGNGYPYTRSNTYHFAGGSWTEVASMPVPMGESGSGVYSGKLYAVGGSAGTAYYSTNVIRFDGTSWAGAPGLPVAASGVGVAILNGNMYAVGGTINYSSATNVYRFNGTSWAAVAGLPAPRSGMAVAALGTNIYAAGGYGAGYNSFSTNVYRFNGTSWTQVKGLPMSLGYTRGVVMDGAMYVVGGATIDFANCTNVFRFDGTNWTEVAGLPLERSSVGLTAHNDTLYAIGGSSGEGDPATNVFVYPLRISEAGVEPSSGLSSGGFEVTITGSNLGNGTDITNVTIRGASVASIVSQSATQVVVVAGVGDPGLGDVRVFSTSHGETVKSDAFTYIGVQVITNFMPADGSDISEDATVGLSATASSGLPVSFSVVSGPGVISDGTNLSFTAAGVVLVEAAQAGNDIWNPASPLTNSYTARGLPVVGPVTLWRATNQVLKVSDLMLMTNSVDPSSSTLTVTWVSSASTNGGSVTFSGHWITYVPPEGDDSTDYFEFRVVNAYGGAGESRAEVRVFTPAAEGQTMNIAGVTPSASNTQVRFVGIPGRLYDVQATTNLVLTPWTRIGQVTIGVQGYVIFTDTNEPVGQFYRTARPE